MMHRWGQIVFIDREMDHEVHHIHVSTKVVPSIVQVWPSMNNIDQ